jgi:hypothetical protein
MHNILKKSKKEQNKDRNRGRRLMQTHSMKMSFMILTNLLMMKKANLQIKFRLGTVFIFNKSLNKKASFLHHLIQNYGKLELKEGLKRLLLLL